VLQVCEASLYLHAPYLRLFMSRAMIQSLARGSKLGGGTDFAGVLLPRGDGTTHEARS
jgi:hypothetical protein